MLDAINETREQNGGRIEDQYVIRFFKDKLLSMPCQNQGFIIDGFPKNMEQAKSLFAGKKFTNVKKSLELNTDRYLSVKLNLYVRKVKVGHTF